MKTLAPIIEHLLLTTDCVVVEGLGGFVRRLEHARYDERHRLYMPPVGVVSFNARLTAEDGLLAESLMLKRGVSYQGARRMISEWVEQIEVALETEGRYVVEGIGTLTRRRGEPISFEPEAQACFAPWLYALPAVAIARKANARHAARPTKHFKVPHPHWHGVAAVAAVVVLFVVGAVSSLDLPRRTVSSPAVATIMGGFVFGEHPAPLYQYQAPKPIAAKPSDGATVQRFAPKAERPKSPQTVTTQTTPTARPYTLVLASQVTRTGAEALMVRLRKTGLPDAHIDERGSMRRVVYSTYATESEAQNALRLLRRQTPEAAEAWVMHTRH